MTTGLEHLTLGEIERRLASDPQDVKAACELARRWLAGAISCTEVVAIASGVGSLL